MAYTIHPSTGEIIYTGADGSSGIVSSGILDSLSNYGIGGDPKMQRDALNYMKGQNISTNQLDSLPALAKFTPGNDTSFLGRTFGNYNDKGDWSMDWGKGALGLQVASGLYDLTQAPGMYSRQKNLMGDYGRNLNMSTSKLEAERNLLKQKYDNRQKIYSM